MVFNLYLLFIKLAVESSWAWGSVQNLSQNSKVGRYKGRHATLTTCLPPRGHAWASTTTQTHVHTHKHKSHQNINKSAGNWGRYLRLASSLHSHAHTRQTPVCNMNTTHITYVHITSYVRYMVCPAYLTFTACLMTTIFPWLATLLVQRIVCKYRINICQLLI